MTPPWHALAPCIALWGCRFSAMDPLYTLNKSVLRGESLLAVLILTDASGGWCCRCRLEWVLCTIELAHRLYHTRNARFSAGESQLLGTSRISSRRPATIGPDSLSSRTFPWIVFLGCLRPAWLCQQRGKSSWMTLGTFWVSSGSLL